MGTGFAARLRDKIGSYIWRREVNMDSALDKKLKELMANGGVTSATSTAQKVRTNIMAEKLLDHAVSRPYAGPEVSGDILAGWPVSELLKQVPQQDRAAVYRAIVEKYSPTPYAPPPGSAQAQNRGLRPKPPSNNEMLCMRMRWDNILAGGFAHVDIHSGLDKVFVLIITQDQQAVVIEDEAALYPSDALVTKLRLMQQGV